MSYAHESEAKRQDPALHPGHRYRRGPEGFVPAEGQRLVRTSMGWLRATEEEIRAGVVLLPMEGGGAYRAEIVRDGEGGDSLTQNEDEDA